MKTIVVLTGAGISAESGLATFRDMGGLWEKHAIEDVATPEAWLKDPALVLRFYNERRAQAAKAQPNAAHIALADLEKKAQVHIITQNVDDLHERAGSQNVLHLHGELRKVRSVKNPYLIKDIGAAPIQIGDKAEDGAQLRPHIVWFGESVPLIEEAARICEIADILIIIGTSLQVYPAAGLVQYVGPSVPIYVIDPHSPAMHGKNVTFLDESAVTGLPKLLKDLDF